MKEIKKINSFSKKKKVTIFSLINSKKERKLIQAN